MNEKINRNKLFICCEEATAYVVRDEVSSLSFIERIALFIHLLYCKFCRLFKKQSQEINSILQSKTSFPSHELSEDKKQALHSLIKNLEADRD